MSDKKYFKVRLEFDKVQLDQIIEDAIVNHKV